jgi:predicted MFS family arabinose efflux permease
VKSRFLQPYAEILVPSGAWRFSAAGWFGRLQRSTNGIAVILLVSSRADGYALAGAVAGAIILGVAIGGPLWARATDRRGQNWVLPRALGTSAVTSVVLLLVIQLGAPTWTWFVAAALLGATSIDTGALARGRWVARLDDPAARHTAFAVEGVLDELAFVVGPPMVTLIATLINPALGFIVGTVLALAGGAWMWTQRETAPQPVALEPGARMSGWMPRGVAGVVPVFFFLGVIFGGIDLAVVGLARGDGLPALAGLILAVFSIGSVLGGIAFGPLSAKWTPARRIVVSTVTLAVAVPIMLLAPSAAALAPLIVFAGLAASPVLISASSYIGSVVDRAVVTTAMAWSSVAVAIGLTVGAIIGGVAIDAGGPHAGLMVCASAAVAAGIAGVTLAALVGSGTPPRTAD